MREDVVAAFHLGKDAYYLYGYLLLNADEYGCVSKSLNQICKDLNLGKHLVRTLLIKLVAGTGLGTGSGTPSGTPNLFIIRALQRGLGTPSGTGLGTAVGTPEKSPPGSPSLSSPDPTILNPIIPTKEIHKEIPPSSKTSFEEPPKRKKFVKPTVEQIREYASTAGKPDYAEAFMDHFEANGWKVSGKSPMVDWKAAYRNWCRNQQRFNGYGTNQRSTYEERTAEHAAYISTLLATNEPKKSPVEEWERLFGSDQP